jgi:hypothetical protein
VLGRLQELQQIIEKNALGYDLHPPPLLFFNTVCMSIDISVTN